MFKHALFMVCLLAVSGRAEAETLRVGSVSLSFEPGDRYCNVDPRASEIERVLFESQTRANAGINAVVAMFADCGQLEELRGGTEVFLEPYGILLASLRGGRPVELPEGYTRARFIDEVAQVIEGGLRLKGDEISRRFNNSLGGILKEALGEVSFSGIEQIGVLHKDATAVHHGVLARVAVGDTNVLQAGVSALTLVRKLALQYTIYSRYQDKTTFQNLLAENRGVMQAFVEAN